MIHRHRLDPPAQHDAAERLGIMVADGLISEQEGGKTMAVIVKTAIQNAPNVDRMGLSTRLIWSAKDAKHDRERQRSNAETAIRWATRPLFAAKATASEIEHAADKANGGILRAEEVAPILRDEMRRAIQKARG